MRRVFSKTAVTLIELMVSLVLISVIVLGIFSINTVLNNNNQDYGQRYLVRSQTQATLNQILNNASLAVGSATTINGWSAQGIILGQAWAPPDPNSFCIYQGNNSSWVCYTWFPKTDPNAPYQILSCSKTYNTGSANLGAGSCPDTAQFVGTAYSISLPSAPSFNPRAGFSITITNCLNDFDPPGTCNKGATQGTSSDPANNPEVQVSGSVFPPQDSF